MTTGRCWPEKKALIAHLLQHPMHWTKALALEHLRIRHDRSFHAIPDLDELLQVHRVLHEGMEGK